MQATPSVANGWHDLMNPDAADIAQDSLRAEYASTWSEIGLGVLVSVAKHRNVYGDARYKSLFAAPKSA